MAASSASTASTKASMSLKASHEAGEVLAVLTAVPLCCGSGDCCEGRRHNPSPSRPSAPLHLKGASRKAPAGTPRLPTDSKQELLPSVAVQSAALEFANSVILLGLRYTVNSAAGCQRQRT